MADHSELVARLRDMGIQCCDLAADAIETLQSENDQLEQNLRDMSDNADSAYRRGYWAARNGQ